MRGTTAGRTRRAIYLFPRDQGEGDRLDIQHYALREALGVCFHAPVTAPARVLDVGCGTGRWAFDVCDRHPDALVVGLDVDTRYVDPGVAPAGFSLLRGNVLEGLPFADDSFDLVHQRLLAASAIPLRSWSTLIAQLVRVTRPGGWVQLVEAMPRLHPLGPTSLRLWELADDLVRLLGLDASGFVAGTLDRYLRQAGLVDVDVLTASLPVGEWGGRIGSLMASHYRAMGIRLSPAFEAHMRLPMADHHEMIRVALEEWEALRSRSTYTIAYGRKP